MTRSRTRHIADFRVARLVRRFVSLEGVETCSHPM